MSKMSELAMELDDQANELGFESYEEALAKGYEWVIDTHGNAVLYKPSEELNKAHEAWLEEKQQVLEEQKELHDHLMELGYDALAESVWHAIGFIERGEV